MLYFYILFFSPSSVALRAQMHVFQLGLSVAHDNDACVGARFRRRALHRDARKRRVELGVLAQNGFRHRRRLQHAARDALRRRDRLFVAALAAEQRYPVRDVLLLANLVVHHVLANLAELHLGGGFSYISGDIIKSIFYNGFLPFLEFYFFFVFFFLFGG
jgi:hypothetical protein